MSTKWPIVLYGRSKYSKLSDTEAALFTYYLALALKLPLIIAQQVYADVLGWGGNGKQVRRMLNEL